MTTYPVTLIMPANKVGAVEAGEWKEINGGWHIKATYTEPFTLAVALLGSMPTEEIIERLKNETTDNDRDRR